MNNNVSVELLIYNGTTSAKDFRQRFELQALFQGWDAAKQLTSLPLFLSGKAERAYNAIATKTDIADVLTALVAALAPSQDILLYAFYERKLRPGEKVSNFALALQELLIKGMPTISDAQRLPMLRAQLCLSLNENLCALVQFNTA